MDLRALRYFLAVAEQGSFTAAAQQLHTAQPAVSMAVRKLEDELGLTLFHRNERRVTLTDEGLVLLPHARQILQGVADAELAMHELHGLQQGEVRIGISNMLGSYYFPPILMAFRERYPGVRLSVVEAGTRAIQRMIMEGEIDIGVVVADAPPAELESRCFLRDQMMAIVPDDHALAQRKAIRFDEFFDEELVLFKQGYFHREVIDRLCAEHGLQANIGFETNLLALIRQIVKQGFAITTLLPMVIRDDPQLVAVPFTQPVWLDLSIAWRRGGYLSVANRTFVEFLLAHSQNKESPTASDPL
ncbi:LysR family transcriptional regulator [Thalassolituus marinus]|uniref:LysR family transcriptional regulator n=1 Tax=Thalassolituus marinus TaxID=671053 RepID=A0ABS7ZS61_9GAMM|nr:LysR substrate-binding domain-containing protein [Thalassolituus marinus]MCA6064491.1 LysR family transcriptional regulator [Thalassolituus marinus]